MHLTDEQLNEYLDHETDNRAQLESHLVSCADCAMRLRDLEALFSEIESLSELAISLAFSALFAPIQSEPVRLPRSLTVTMILQAVLAVVAIVIAAPFVMQFVSSYAPSPSFPSLVDLFLQLQIKWTTLLDTLSTLSFPAVPEIPAVNVSGLVTMFTVLGVSLLWLIGNGLLLRNQMK